MHWMFVPLRRYADFSGRSRRLEYWMFTLGMVIILVLFLACAMALSDMASQDPDGGVPGTMMWIVGLTGIAWLAIIIPSIAVQVRRFHDQNLTGWLVLIGFIPYIGGLIVLVFFMCLPGTKGDNRFGTDPLDPDGTERLTDVFG